MQTTKQQAGPEHIAIIMDGNGRWADNQGRPRLFGHRAGVQALDAAVTAAPSLGIRYLTVFAFSTENWKRGDFEVQGLMLLFAEQLEAMRPRLVSESVRLVCIGNREDGRLPSSLLAKISEIEHATDGGRRLTLVIALNYSTEDELQRATKKALANQSVAVTEYLDTAGMPSPDIVIRTGCEDGCWYDSGFLCLQSAQSLKIPLTTYWPDFSGADLEKAIARWQEAPKLQGAQRVSVG
jgi:undecaprenyl diphosphate synthase